MGNLLSLQRSIQGDYSSNDGSHNTFGSTVITNINYSILGGRNPTVSYDKILQQLYRYPPGSGYKSHRNRVPEPAKGTCTWVTGHLKYKEWLENRASGLLWLSADPGCGKSVIASFLVGHLERQSNATVCYFFFKDDSDEQKSATFALRAILHQLFVQRPGLSRYAEGAFRAKGSSFAEEVDTLWDILVEAVAKGGCGDVICVVDALDECDEATIAPLIRHITRLPEPQPSGIPLKFLVTSRPYHRIEVELGSPATTIRLKGEEEVNSIAADVALFIDEGIEKLESHWGRAGGLGYLRDLLNSSADRTFLWISLVLQTLKDSLDDSTEVFTKIVTTAPGNLAQFYTKILDGGTNPVEARQILNIVLAAARPLTLREMNAAFRIRPDHKTIRDLGGLSPGFEKTVKNLCGLFVRVIDEKIYLVHQTAREFLIKGSSQGQGNWQYTMCSVNSNFMMADICLTYLSLDDFENQQLLTGVESSDAVDECLREHALLGYAANHWPDHFRDSQGRQMELFERTRLICKPSNRRCTWLTVFWEMYRLRYPFPRDFTHLMIASWLGQGAAVERILEEGGDLGTRSKDYGTALDVAALRGYNDIAKMLVEGNIVTDVGGKEYNILNTKRSALDEKERELEAVEEWAIKEERRAEELWTKAAMGSEVRRRREPIFLRRRAKAEHQSQAADAIAIHARDRWERTNRDKQVLNTLKSLCVEDKDDNDNLQQ